MPISKLDDLFERLHSLESELEKELEQMLDAKRQQFRYQVEQGKVRFEQGIKALQKRQRLGIWSYLRSARFGHLISSPLIYSVFIPFVVLDIMVTLYQHICFRIYGIPRVQRSRYFIIDRQHLAYLNAIEKINCTYCGYGNGLIEYIREITARTEQYWCPIKHARRTPDPHSRVEHFTDYGDAENYRQQLDKLRRELRQLEQAHQSMQ